MPHFLEAGWLTGLTRKAPNEKSLAVQGRACQDRAMKGPWSISDTKP